MNEGQQCRVEGGKTPGFWQECSGPLWEEYLGSQSLHVIPPVCHA